MRSRFRALLAAFFATSLLTSCQSGEGPIRIGQELLSNCLPAAPGDSILIGRVVTGPPEQAILGDAMLKQPEGVKLLDSYVIPATEGTIGSSPYPPVDFPPWEDRVSLSGAHLEPGVEYTILLRVFRESEGNASADGLTLEYRVGGSTYSTSTATRYEFRNTCS